jgi:CHAT domain-containing protein
MQTACSTACTTVQLKTIAFDKPPRTKEWALSHQFNNNSQFSFMDFRHVCSIFGGTLFYDDLHTDMAIGCTRLNEYLADASASSLDRDAAIVLLRAVLCLLQGDFTSATDHLASLCNDEVHAQQHPRWEFRAKAYSALLSTWRDFPPLLRSCDLRGPALAVWMNRQSYDNGAHFLTECAQSEHAMSELDGLEYNVISVVCRSHHIIPIVRRLHESNTEQEFSLAQRKRHYTHFSRLFAQVKDLIEASLRVELPLVAAYLLRIEYDLALASGDPTAVQYLDVMKSIYSALEDSTGLGQYCLIQGDYSLSAHRTSPSVLNLIIIDHLDDCGGDSTMYFADSGEHDADLERLRWDERIDHQCSPSKRWYAKAKEHFDHTNSTRGLATIAFREACVLRIRSMQPEAVWGEPSRDSEVIEMLTRGALLAQKCRDKQLEVLIQVHRLGIGNVSLEMRNEVHQIAHWAHDCGNMVFALGLALFAMRLGHYHRYILALPAHNEGYEICRQIIKEVHAFWTVWYRAMLAQFNVGISLGQRNYAIIWAGHMKECAGLMLAECTETVKEPGVGIYTVLCIVTAVIDAEIQLGPADTGKSEFPDNPTKELLDFLEVDILMATYLRDAYIRFRYSAAVTSYQRHLQEGQVGAAQSALRNYLQESRGGGRKPLVVNLQIVDALHQAGDFDEAKDFLDTYVEDDDKFEIVVPSFQGTANLAMAMARAVQQCRLHSLEAIFLACVNVKHWERAARIMPIIEEISPGYFTSVTSYTNLRPWQRCLYAGLVLEDQRHYREAYLYFLQARYFLLDMSEKMADDDFRLLLAKPEVTRLMGSAARRALMWTTDYPSLATLGPSTNSAINRNVFRMFTIEVHYQGLSEHLMEALVFLEAARPQYIWSEAGNDFTPEQAEAQYKYELWKELMKKTHRTPEEEIEFQDLHPHREEYFTVFNQTSHLRKKTRALSMQSVASFFQSIPENAILLYIFATQDGSVLMALDNQKVRMALFHPDATLAMLEKSVMLYVNAIKDNDKAAMHFLGPILDEILIEPLKNCIDKRGHIIFVLSGVLTRLPVSALRYNGEYLILQREVSQVPSFRALHSLQSRPRPRAAQEQLTVNVIARPGNPRDQWLPMAGIEALLIGAMCAKPAINAKDVSREDFRRLVRDSQFLHICTHGVQDADHPFNSQIILKEKFRVLDMLAVRSTVSLVTFSACHSGVGHATDSGDIQGFSHAVLAAGANAYLGALWKVDDIATMIHMFLFYANLFLVQDKPSFSEAWRLATEILYSLTTEEAIGYLEQFVDFWDLWEANGQNPGELAGKTGKKKLLGAIKDWKAGKNIVHFDEPRIWAPFVMVGNASLRIWTTMQGFADRLHRFKQANRDASHQDLIAYCKSLGQESFKPFQQDACRHGNWEGAEEAPVPKEFLDPSWHVLITHGGFEGTEEAQLPESFDLV